MPVNARGRTDEPSTRRLDQDLVPLGSPVLALRSVRLGVAAGVKATIAATPRTRDFVWRPAEARGHLAGAAARRAGRAVWFLGHLYAYTRTATRTPSPTGNTAPLSRSSASNRSLKARAVAICSSDQYALPLPSATVPDISTLSTASTALGPSSGTSASK